jgi:oligosaccharide reducing-end xylanase
MSVIEGYINAYRSQGLSGLYNYAVNGEEMFTQGEEAAAAQENPSSVASVNVWDVLRADPTVYILRLIVGGSFGCEASGPVNEVCDDSYSPPIQDVAVDLNMTLQAGRPRFHFSIVVPENGRGSIPAGMQSMWVRFGLEGSDMLEPTGLPMLDVEGFRMLLDLSEEDPIGYVSYRPMRDSSWGEQVYIYEGTRVVRHRVVDWSLPEPEERDVWLAVNADGQVICEACIEDEAAALANDASNMLPLNENGDVDISQLEMAFAYYYVNVNGQYRDENANLSETPVQVPASRNPEGREYELVADPEFSGFSAEEFRNMLREGIPERGIAAMSEEDINAISIPLRARLVITDQSGRNMEQQSVPESGQINLGNMGQTSAVMIERRFYPDSEYRIGFEGFGQEGERAEGDRHEGAIPEFIYGGSRVRLALLASCDESEPGYQQVVQPQDAGPADADEIVPGSDADGDMDADADEIVVTDGDQIADGDIETDADTDDEVSPSGAYYTGVYPSAASLIGSRYTQTEAEAICASAYERFLLLIEDGAVIDTETGLTRSENQSYGMLLASQHNDQANFNSTWEWTVSNMRSFEYPPLIAWTCLPPDCADERDDNSAPDADALIALSLYFASSRWGDGAYPFDYSVQARAIADGILANAVTAENYLAFSPRNLERGEEWFSPSYQMPGVFALLGIYTGNSRWEEIESNSYTLLYNTLSVDNGNMDNGLVPNGCLQDGSAIPGGTGSLSYDYGYDAMRAAFFFGVTGDYWFGDDARARDYVDRVVPFFARSIGVEDLGDNYALNGAELSSYHAPSWVGSLAGASMGGTSEADRVSFLNHLLDIVSRGDDLSYYDLAWVNFGCLAATGNFRIY